MRVECEIDESEVESDYGNLIEGVVATCSRCGHQTESAGTSERSERRCLVLMRDECPKGESNFYVPEAG